LDKKFRSWKELYGGIGAQQQAGGGGHNNGKKNTNDDEEEEEREALAWKFVTTARIGKTQKKNDVHLSIY
jgi:hypothetical protein